MAREVANFEGKPDVLSFCRSKIARFMDLNTFESNHLKKLKSPFIMLHPSNREILKVDLNP
jgi:hypothetical protein